MVAIVMAIIIVGVGTFYFVETNQKISEKTEDIKFDIERVEDKASYAEKIISICKDDVQCAVSGLQDVSKNEEQKIVFSTFDDLVALYESSYPCHEVAHHLGMWLYGYIGDVPNALKLAKMVCGGAIYHGVIQNYLATEHFGDTDPSDIVFEKICPKIEGHYYSIDRWQCLHGLGHGLSVFYDYDVFAAVKICEKLDPGWEQISCSKGVFMQNNVFNSETGEGTFDEKDKFFPCNQVEDKWAPSCYHYHATYILKTNGWELFSSFNDCDKLEKEYIKFCYHGMGRQLTTNVGSDIEKAKAFCSSGQKIEYHTDCFRGMVMTIVNFDTNPEPGFNFCKLVPEEFKSDCYDALGRWVIMLHPTEEGRTGECVKAENSEYFDVCMNASLESLKLL